MCNFKVKMCYLQWQIYLADLVVHTRLILIQKSICRGLWVLGAFLTLHHCCIFSLTEIALGVKSKSKELALMCNEGTQELGLFSSKNSTVTYGDFFSIRWSLSKYRSLLQFNRIYFIELYDQHFHFVLSGLSAEGECQSRRVGLSEQQDGRIS